MTRGPWTMITNSLTPTLTSPLPKPRCREGAKVTDRTSSAELDAAADASRDRKKALTIKARSDRRIERRSSRCCLCEGPQPPLDSWAHRAYRVALTPSSRRVLRTSVQGYKAQADLVLSHLDGLLDGCQVLRHSRCPSQPRDASAPGSCKRLLAHVRKHC